ncbi:CBS domain-containing protein [Phorcysia thermohydrogeniphila]|uniref:tRNA nucleotidyltransferase (CCA-adding enzyme) n=1 Tax=Phorcysia thermohydrogeniphila TaxID=936138 RepID=A0A4R1GE73_9BACT|nr:CBS domain-containing protein [Phorcysia thermohydrogeniphila]TCK06484.1 tRNA nucleotidyltransferase (CCA-adding enzyme) [Phorcysia thermohydrogeniphila]
MESVITTHKNMDLDSLGAVVAAKKLFPEATVVLPDAKGSDVIKLLSENPDLLEFVGESSFKGKIKKLIVVDTDSLERIPKSVASGLSPDSEVIVYDHHSPVFSQVEEADVHYKHSGSVTSLMVLLLKGKGIIPSPLEASVMLTGIYADTGSFRFPTTSPLDFVAAAYLLALGARLEFVKKYLPLEMSDRELDVLKVLKDNLVVTEVHGNRIGITYARFDSYVGEVAHLVSKLLEITGLPALLAAVETQGATFLIGRSQTEKVDVSKVVGRFGGGGHPEAASATVKGKTAFEVLEELRRVLYEEVEPLRRAADIMTSPPITVKAGASVKEARALLMKNSINAAPVVDREGKIVGIVSRALLDKAVYMGLEEERVSDVMERDFFSVSPETSLDEVEEIIVERHQTFVPVVEKGRPVGVITRTDILMNLYRNELADISRFYEKRASLSPRFKNVAAKLKEVLPEELFNLIKEIGKFADERKVNAYIIGGFVRDLIIGRKNFDVDIVIEGDATVFAKELAKRFGAKVHTYERFKTATVVFKGGKRIDFASARTEVYRAPGALPEVDMAPLKKDLMRRDFTINTLAIKINEKEFGKLIDFFGGLKDIKDKKIRVLHSLSFVEDPTRILRALRFATRYRFELGKHTERLLKIAVQRKLFKTVEGQRIYHELKQIFLEDNPLRVMNKLEKYRIISSLFPSISWDRFKKDLFERIRKVIIWHKLNFPEKETKYHILYFGALFLREPLNRVEKYIKELAVPQKEAELLFQILKNSLPLIKKVRLAGKNSEVYELLQNLPEEFLLFLAALPQDEETRNRVLNYLKSWRFIKPLVNGEDLKSMGLKPGPVFKKILSKLKYAIIDGELPNDREEQLTRAKELVDAEKR